MFNKTVMCTAAITAGIAVCSSDISAKDRKTYEASVYSVFQSLPSNSAASGVTTRKMSMLFPGWAVTTDKINGTFTDIYGAPTGAAGGSNSAKAAAFMNQQLRQAGINATEWKQVSDIQAPKADYINFTQSIDGHPVVYSWLSFRFTKDGKLARIQMMNHGTANEEVTASLTAEEAKTKALTAVTGATVKNATVAADWEWFPIPAAGGYTLHPAWHFEITGSSEGSVPLDLTGYIDATDGSLLERTNETKETGYDITVKGNVYKYGTLLPPSLEPLPDLTLMIDTATIANYTDANGLFSSSLLSIPAITSIPLTGRWATVYDSASSSTPVYSDTVLLAGTTFTYPALAPYSDRHVNAYYHVNRVHNFMKGYFPAFTQMDFSLPTNVDISAGTCNAFYNKKTINFYSASAGCNSFAEIGDIIYHEYGHGISDQFYTKVKGSTMRNGSLNEACSDIWALSITKNPILGQNAFVGYGGFIRRYDMMPQVYPMDLETNTTYADVHKNGQIIAGCWWDVGVNLGSVDSMTKLFTDVYFDVPDGSTGKEGSIYQTILVDALLADDDNSNILDGTPHYAQIVAAFAKHGIYLGGDIKLTHTELTHQAPSTPVNVNATLAMTTSKYFNDLTLYYRVNGKGAWNAIAMADSGHVKFNGTIPGQPMGTAIEYYFVVHDPMKTNLAYFPTTFNTDIPENQRTLPYQFAVGIQPGESNNFDGTISGWLIGGVPGDDATTKWRQAIPTKNAHFTDFPAGDHTTDSAKCLITGTSSSGTFGAGVAGGTSSVLSPVFSTMRFKTPVVEYYRWFSNEQGYENFKNDPFIVKVRNSPTGTWQTVENTYQGDNNWRRRVFRADSYLPSGSTQLQMMYVISDSVIHDWADNGQSVTVGGIDDFFIYDMANTLETPAVAAIKAAIYPNPADDRVQIELQAGSEGTASLYDMLGRKVTEIAISPAATIYSISTKAIAAGQYNLILQTNFSIQSAKIVVVHN